MARCVWGGCMVVGTGKITTHLSLCFSLQPLGSSKAVRGKGGAEGGVRRHQRWKERQKKREEQIRQVLLKRRRSEGLLCDLYLWLTR